VVVVVVGVGDDVADVVAGDHPTIHSAGYFST